MPEDKRVVINSTDTDDEKVTVEVVRPTAQHLRDAQLAYNRAFRDALESGALLRQKLEEVPLHAERTAPAPSISRDSLTPQYDFGPQATLPNSYNASEFLNRWNFISVVYDGNNKKIYINGIEVSSNNNSNGICCVMQQRDSCGICFGNS